MVEEWKATIAREGDTYDERITITPQPQSSITIMDQKTGQIKAMVGGRGEKASSLGLNRAYQGSKRQPGSTFKILAAYAPALDSCDKTLATTIDDEEYEYKNGQSVNNWDKKYIGPTRVRYGIEHSMNVLAVKTLTDYVGETESYDYLLDRYRKLSMIELACPLSEYESKNQRKLMTKELRRQIMIRDDYTCQICGKYMPDEVGLQIDHIIPVSKGGKTIPSNLQTLCSKCNGKKANKL